jgi:hypothetical protein
MTNNQHNKGGVSTKAMVLLGIILAAIAALIFVVARSNGQRDGGGLGPVQQMKPGVRGKHRA